jgi:hypothetical protein
MPAWATDLMRDIVQEAIGRLLSVQPELDLRDRLRGQREESAKRARMIGLRRAIATRQKRALSRHRGY